MAVLTRTTPGGNFLPGTLIQSQQANDELNQLINALAGGITTKHLVVTFSDGSVAPLILDQKGAGLIQEWKQNGSQTARVNNNGSFQTSQQLISSLATGTKPIDVASTTVCTNLNADLLDGLNGTQFVRNDAAGQGVTDNFAITGTAPQLDFLDSNGEDFRLLADADNLVISNLTGPITFLTFRGGANDDILVGRKTTFDDDVVITDDHLQINTSAGLNANNRLVVNHSESPQTDAAVSFRAGATNVRPLDLVGEAAGTVGLFRCYEDNDADPRFRISNDGLVETRAGNGATPSTDFISLMGAYEVIHSTANNGTTVETDLHSKTIAANVLAADGDFIKATFAGTFANNANTKTWRVYFGGTQIGGAAAVYTNCAWIIHVLIIRIDSDSAKCIVHQEVQSNLVNSIVNYNQVDGLNFAGTIILKVTGQSDTASNDVTQQMSLILKGNNQ